MYNLQFITDLHPDDANCEIAKVLADEVFTERKANMNTWTDLFNEYRFMPNATMINKHKSILEYNKVNCKESTVKALRNLKQIHLSKSLKIY